MLDICTGGDVVAIEPFHTGLFKKISHRIFVDGWQSHGQHLKNWHEDKIRDQAFLRAGILTWRFSNKQAEQATESALEIIALLKK